MLACFWDRNESLVRSWLKYFPNPLMSYILRINCNAMLQIWKFVNRIAELLATSSRILSGKLKRSEPTEKKPSWRIIKSSIRSIISPFWWKSLKLWQRSGGINLPGDVFHSAPTLQSCHPDWDVPFFCFFFFPLHFFYFTQEEVLESRTVHALLEAQAPAVWEERMAVEPLTL